MSENQDRSRDRAPGAAGSDGAVWGDVVWDDIVIPDDTRDLAADIAAYHRELRQSARGWRRLGDARRGRTGVPTPTLAIAACITVVSLLAMILTVHGSRPRLVDPPITQQPARTGVPDGQIGGLLPAATLSTISGQPQQSQSLYPGLVAVLPPHCNCAAELNKLATTGAAHHSATFIVAPAAPGKDADADVLPGQLHSEVVHYRYDATAALGTGLTAHGLTVVAVDGAGRISDIARDVVSNDTRPAAMLTAMQASAQKAPRSG